MGAQPVESEWLSALVTQGPAESTSALGELKTRDRGVQMRPSTPSEASRIGYDGRAVRIRSENHSQQLTFGGSLPTADAGPHGPSTFEKLLHRW